MGNIPVVITFEGSDRGPDKGVEMLEQAQSAGGAEGEFVEFAAAGTEAKGAYHCADCGYGITVTGTLPQCPMCAGTTWEPVEA
jgi:rubrerythrin